MRQPAVPDEAIMSISAGFLGLTSDTYFAVTKYQLTLRLTKVVGTADVLEEAAVEEVGPQGRQGKAGGREGGGGRYGTA